MTYALIDSTIARAHQHSAGAQNEDGEDQTIGRGIGSLGAVVTGD